MIAFWIIGGLFLIVGLLYSIPKYMQIIKCKEHAKGIIVNTTNSTGAGHQPIKAFYEYSVNNVKYSQNTNWTNYKLCIRHFFCNYWNYSVMFRNFFKSCIILEKFYWKTKNILMRKGYCIILNGLVSFFILFFYFFIIYIIFFYPNRNTSSITVKNPISICINIYCLI